MNKVHECKTSFPGTKFPLVIGIPRVLIVRLPKPNGVFAPALREDAEKFAGNKAYRIARLSFEYPEELSPLGRHVSLLEQEARYPFQPAPG